MKTTLDLHDALMHEAKAFAAQKSLSLTRLIEEGLRLRLRSDKTPVRTVRRPMPIFHPPKGKGGFAADAKALSGLSGREMFDYLDAQDSSIFTQSKPLGGKR